MNYTPRHWYSERLMSIQETAAYLTVSRQHLWQLVQQGEFPAPLLLVGRRRAWRHSDVIAWVQALVDARPDAQAAVVRSSDHLLSMNTVSGLVLLSPQQIVRMEARGAFPRRIQISAGRIVWLEHEIDDWMRKLAAS